MIKQKFVHNRLKNSVAKKASLKIQCVAGENPHHLQHILHILYPLYYE